MNYLSGTAIFAVFLFTGCGNKNDTVVTSSGTIEATDVTVSAQAGGIVKLCSVEEGSVVRTGDTLLIIDDVDWRYQYDQAAAGCAMAEAQYRLAVKGSRSEDVAQAEATYKNAEVDLKRTEELWLTRSVTEKQLDDARTRLTVAQQTWEKIKNGSRPEEIDLARARRDQAQAQKAALKKKLNDCFVVAPIQGVVTKRFVEAGELVGSGGSLIRLDDLSSLDITIYVPEADVPKIALGLSATVHVDAFPNRTFDGHVVFISPIAEFTPKNIQTNDERTKLVFAVKIKVPNTDGTLKAGIPADVTLHVRQS
jgi:HlyD family secretion protein